MDVQWSSVVIAKYLGQVLTPEVAREVVIEIDAGPNALIDISQFAPLEYKGYVIQAERFADIIPELHILHERHWSETESYMAGVPMNPDYERAKKLERNGVLLQCTARKDGDLVANMRVYIGTSIHTQTLYCHEDTFYVLPEHRGGFLAVRLWQYVERAVIALGVRQITFDSKTSNRADSMARYLKYQAVGIKFSKIV